MSWIKSLSHNIRFYVLCFSILFSFAVYLIIISLYPLEQLQIIRLTQIYALTAVIYLYLALLAGPFCYMFGWFPFKAQYLKSRRALGVSAFYFAFLHTCLAFFGQLGGFEGLGFLSGKYLIAISLSVTALTILLFMAITSFDKVINWMKFKRWKLLHRLVYLAGILILIHALMLGTHFQNLWEFIPQAFFTALVFLLFLEIVRIDAFFKKRFKRFANVSIVSVPLYVLLLLGIIYFLIPIPSESGISFGIHAQHIQLAKDAQNGITGFSPSRGNVPNIPGLRGDRTKRFTLDTNIPENIQPNIDSTITFKVFDASSGNQVIFFNKVYSKIVHMIIVDSSLTYFNHIHPEQTEDGFTITTQFPKEGAYRVYFDFQPFGAIEQQIATTVNVGNFDKPAISNGKPDTKLTKTFGEYEITLKKPSLLKSDQISIGQQLLSFTFNNAKTKQPIKTLKPYLESFGHLVMVNQKTFEYVHVHPADLTVPPPDANGGPTVEFMPLGMYGPIKPGIYRVFAQFNPNGQLMVADYTIEVEK